MGLELLNSRSIKRNILIIFLFVIVQFCASFSVALAEDDYEYDEDSFTPIQHY